MYAIESFHFSSDLLSLCVATHLRFSSYFFIFVVWDIKPVQVQNFGLILISSYFFTPRNIWWRLRNPSFLSVQILRSQHRKLVILWGHEYGKKCNISKHEYYWGPYPEMMI